MRNNCLEQNDRDEEVCASFIKAFKECIQVKKAEMELKKAKESN